MDDQLNTFIAVADQRSFNRAANQLFISAPAVIKQINALEERIKVRLFNRSHSGVTLTKVGEAFYQDATKLVSAYQDSINRAQNLEHDQLTLKVGVGPLAAGMGTGQLWQDVCAKLPNLTLKFIPCSCSLGSFNEFLNAINQDFDLVASIYDDHLLAKFHLQATPLDETPVKISVPMQNPLSQKNRLTLADLAGQTVAITKQGEFACFDQARELIEAAGGATIQDLSGIDVGALNQCVANNWLLVSAEDWQSAHPMLAAKEVDWNCQVPLGLIYGAQHSPVVDRVLAVVQELE